MRILANENLPAQVINALIAAGHDVLWIRMEMPGATDEAVMARAHADERLVLTFDKDFGEMVYRRGLPPSCAVILLRFGVASPESLAERVVAILGSRTDWGGHFSVIEETRIRMRRLPEPPAGTASIQ